jgi:hypothetical protein
VTLKGVKQARKLSEKPAQKRTGSASAAGFVATVAELFRSGKRVRAWIAARQAPFRKERGTPCGCASLRGVDRPRSTPVKALPLCSECLSLPRAGATLSGRRSASRKELSSIVQLNKTAFSLRPSQSTLRTASGFLTSLDPVPVFGLLAHDRQRVTDCAKCRIRRVDQAREKPTSS